MIGQKEDLTLLQLLSDYRHCQASDPRNRFFTLAGLAKDPPLAVNCTKAKYVFR